MFNPNEAVDYMADLVGSLGGNAIDAAATRWADDERVTVTRAGFAYWEPSTGPRLLTEREHGALARYLATIEFPLDAVTVHHVARLSA